MIPLIACEIPFGQDVFKLVFGVDVFDLDFFGSKLIRSNNQSNANLWVLETCLIVGLLPLMIILITASLFSTNIQQSFLTRGLDISRNRTNVFHHITFLLRLMTFVNIIIKLPRPI